MSDVSRIEAIFLEALQHTDPDARAAFLDRACGGNPETRRQVERLLEAHPLAGRYLEPAGADETRSIALDPDPVAQEAGSVVGGRYKLLEPIGEGGMGSVWMAQQTEPVRRVVALKLIKAGMDTKAVLARFEAERQALALMDHPNIARVLDAGATEEGRPFFVMELVKGVPITRYCDGRKLSLRERLDLFIPVCQAVQHAHQKGVIHRDLKPSNVLVARYDDRPVPKVIDFGIAKAAGQPLTDRTLVTGFGAVVGTPEYMSPEQAQFNQLDVDTRSDIYALGVLLYELLTGSTPVTRGELEKAGLLEVLRMIRETEPPRPSTRLSTAEGLPQIAANRASEPKALAGLLRNDLDWIVMKSLEKDRNRRYETATGLAADVGRYLAGEAVQAHPPSAAYRLRKFARKNRAAIITTLAIIGLLIAAAGVSTYLAVKARRAETVAEFKRLEAELNAKLADYHKNVSLESLDQSVEARIDADFRAQDLEIELSLKELTNDQNAGLLRLARCVRSMPDRWVTTIPRTRTDDDPEANQLLELHAALTRTPGGKAKPMSILFGGVSSSRHLSEYPKQLQLREFATMAVLAAGQQFAPLLTPIPQHDSKIRDSHESPITGRLLNLHNDKTARLWDSDSGRLIAVLSRASEQVIEVGLSPDGLTAFTHALDGIVRLWDTENGTYRAATEPRPGRIKHVGFGLSDPFARPNWAEINVTSLSNNRLLTSSEVRQKYNSDNNSGSYSISNPGPVELWDAKTGRLIGRPDVPRPDRDAFGFTSDGRWIIAAGSVLPVFVGGPYRYGSTEIHVSSADDGRSLGKLAHGDDSRFVEAPPALSPSGKTLAALTQIGDDTRMYVHIWDTSTWRLISVTGPCVARHDYGNHLDLLDDNQFFLGNPQEHHVYRSGIPGPTTEPPSPLIANLPGPEVRRDGERYLFRSGLIYDARTGRRLMPPKGRKYHPDLARFAPDSRFVPDHDDKNESETNTGEVLIDTVTEKVPPSSGEGYHHRSGLGWAACEITGLGDLVFLRLPPRDRLDIPADLLELWGQVAVRGQLDEEGNFVKWDEPTWEKKRQELAARPVPYPDFPFPGHVAGDRLHWLRQEYENATESDRPALARQLLDRAEAIGDQAEASRWRKVLAPKPNEAGK